MRKRLPIFLRLIEGADTDGAAPETGQETSGPDSDTGQGEPTPADMTEDADEPLGDGGKRALAAEREAHKAAQRDLAAARQLISEKDVALEAANKRADEASAERDALRLETARHVAAASAGLSAFWAGRLQGSTPDELEADAKAIAAALPERATTPVLPPDPSQGRGSGGQGGGTLSAGRDLYHQTHTTKE